MRCQARGGVDKARGAVGRRTCARADHLKGGRGVHACHQTVEPGEVGLPERPAKVPAWVMPLALALARHSRDAAVLGSVALDPLDRRLRGSAHTCDGGGAHADRRQVEHDGGGASTTSPLGGCSPAGGMVSRTMVVYVFSSRRRKRDNPCGPYTHSEVARRIVLLQTQPSCATPNPLSSCTSSARTSLRYLRARTR